MYDHTESISMIALIDGRHAAVIDAARGSHRVQANAAAVNIASTCRGATVILRRTKTYHA